MTWCGILLHPQSPSLPLEVSYLHFYHNTGWIPWSGVVNLSLVFLICMEPAGSQGTGTFTVDGEEQLKVSPGSESDFPGKHGKTRTLASRGQQVKERPQKVDEWTSGSEVCA